MTTADQLRSAIVKAVSSVDNIGRVHDYERFSKHQSDMKSLYQDGDRILGWNIRRGSHTDTELATGIFSVRGQWMVTGYMSLDDKDQTEKTFDVLSDTVKRRLRQDTTFGGIGQLVPNYQIKAEPDTVMFFGILCHSVVITFDTVHEEQNTCDALDSFERMVSQIDSQPHETETQHDQWLQEPADHSKSQPEVIDHLETKESNNGNP